MFLNKFVANDSSKSLVIISQDNLVFRLFPNTESNIFKVAILVYIKTYIILISETAQNDFHGFLYARGLGDGTQSSKYFYLGQISIVFRDKKGFMINIYFVYLLGFQVECLRLKKFSGFRPL